MVTANLARDLAPLCHFKIPSQQKNVCHFYNWTFKSVFVTNLARNLHRFSFGLTPFHTKVFIFARCTMVTCRFCSLIVTALKQTTLEASVLTLLTSRRYYPLFTVANINENLISSTNLQSPVYTWSTLVLNVWINYNTSWLRYCFLICINFNIN